jgi:hypothetical protein
VQDLLWDDVMIWFDPDVNGTLPDVHVPNTSIDDWQALVDLVRAQDWTFAYLVDGEPRELPARVQDMLSRHDEGGGQLNVWPAPGVLAIFRPYTADEIDFDVDLRELQGQQRLDLLCAFFRTIDRQLGKPVLMTPEGSGNDPVLGYDVDDDRVVLLTDR